MLYFDGLGGLIMLGLWIFCFIDAVMTPPERCRNLPKLAWVFIVLILPLVGSIGWLVAGRPWDRTAAPVTRRDERAWQRSTRAPQASNPDDDEEFLAGLRRRAEEQRRRAQDQQGKSVDGDGER